ncbi:MAG: hypothetical protein ABI759_21345 [Candidatus Solibacter sp.]
MPVELVGGPIDRHPVCGMRQLSERLGGVSRSRRVGNGRSGATSRTGMIAVASVTIFLGVHGYARWGGPWRTDIPSQLYFELIPRANEFAHP